MMNHPVIQHQAELCVIGGGMSGLIAAVAAARHGTKVLLMQDRPMLGGNASSEIRMWIRGAHGKENRETGILQEIEMENIYRNPEMNFSLWDSVLLQTVLNEKNITLLTNCSCLDCEMKGGKITSVTGWQLNTYTMHRVEATLFMDCSGDSILAPLTGARYRVGREDTKEYDEYGACEVADNHTMGNSILLQARETDHPVPFVAPEWAYVYPDDASMHDKNHVLASCNFWWIELGGEIDTIGDAQEINWELLRTVYGVWDHIKNRGDHGAENWELEWIGVLPGKRESRRYVGPYVLNQRDLEEGHDFQDTVAFGGWTMDNHSPLGFKYPGYSSRHIDTKLPYQIPFRCLYSENVKNLMFAGRNISATHMAMSSTRVMATCSVMGQAAGTGAALAIEKNCLPEDVTANYMPILQQRLMEDGCFLPGLVRQVPDGLELSLTEEEKAVLTNGWERPHEGVANSIMLKEGSGFTASLKQPAVNAVLRVVPDTDFSRESISNEKRYQTFAMKCQRPKDTMPLNMPAPMLKGATLRFETAEGKVTAREIADNRLPLLRITLPTGTVRVTVENLTSWGGNGVGLFAFDVKEQY